MLGLSQHLFAEQHFDLVMRKCVFSAEEELRVWGELAGEGGGTVRGETKKRKAQEEEQ